MLKFLQQKLQIPKLLHKQFSSHLPKDYYDIDKIRNFCIIAHIDHGKSTLADRLLEITGTIQVGGQNQYLDKLLVEKERGITVKAQSASMYYEFKGKQYLLNLIDTPGHVDFQYEVSRSLQSCQGVILLVDATQGIQAQTVSNYELALLQDLTIIPALNKIDMIGAQVEGVKNEINIQFGIPHDKIQGISAKTGLNVQNLLELIITNIAPPKADINKRFKGYLIDSWFVKDKGVMLLMDIKDGFLTAKQSITSCAFNKKYEIFEVGIMNPEIVPKEYITAGQIGYVFTNMKSAAEARIGDTFHLTNKPVDALPGFKPAKQMVFSGLYPEDPKDYGDLDKALQKLILTDPSVSIVKESSAALGNGFRCGFLGLLHMEVFQMRLDQEYNISALLTTPSVSYRAKLRNGKTIEIENALTCPEPHQVLYFEEPIVEANMILPNDSIDSVVSLLQQRRGEQISMISLDERKYLVKYHLPLAEVIIDLFDKLKSMTRGYGSMEFDIIGYREADIKKLQILLMGDPVDALSFMVHDDRAEIIGRSICLKLKEKLPAQLFQIKIQAKLGSRIIASEDVRALSKNVTAKCYGGDYSRKKKLIERQKEGKKNLRKIGKVDVEKNTFMDLLKI